MIRIVNFYKNEALDEIHTLCKKCKLETEREVNFEIELVLIDKAGDWDICEICEAQNIPSWYNHKPPFVVGVIN